MVFKLRYRYMVLVFALLAGLSLLPHVPKTAVQASAANGDTPVYVPILMYHGILHSNWGKDIIAPYELENDLQYLKENGYTAVTIGELIAYVHDGKPLPEKPIVLSFDDGYRNVYVHGFPLLQAYNTKMVFSLIGKSTDDFSQYPDDNLLYSYATWDEINEMLASGLVELQNHSYDLHTKARGRIGCTQKPGESYEEYERTLTQDLMALQERMEEMTGSVATAFTYPYGRSSENTLPIVKKLGFQATLSCDYGVNAITRTPECLYQLKRISRSHGDNIKKLLEKAYKTVR